MFDFFTVLELRKVINAFGADVVHTHRNKGNLHGRIAAYLSPEVSIATTHHDMSDIKFSRTASLKHRPNFTTNDTFDDGRPNIMTSVIYPYLTITLNRLNHKVIGVSDSVRAIYTADPTDNRFETVYAPYDEAIFKPQRRRRETKKIVIGTVGRLVKPKGYIYLLQAAGKLIQANKGIRIEIIGDGPMRGELEGYIRENSLTDYITLPGVRPHDADLFEKFDVYVQPSISEGCSITLLEAMGCGLPVVASDIDGPRELIVSGKSGILVPPKNPLLLADAILDLINDTDKSRELGRAAAERVLNNYSSKVFASRMSKIYEEITADRR